MVPSVDATHHDHGGDILSLPSTEQATADARALLESCISDIVHTSRGAEAAHLAWYYERRAMTLNGTLYAMRRAGADVAMAEAHLRVCLDHAREIAKTGGLPSCI